jgi:hypothetical protein
VDARIDPGRGAAGRTASGRDIVLLNLDLPRINPYATNAVIKTLYAPEGAALGLGAKLLDLTVDLTSAAMIHDCPPVSHYRIVLRDRVWLRRLSVAVGETLEVGEPIALFSTESDEPLDSAPARPVRITVAGVMFQFAPWDEVAP